MQVSRRSTVIESCSSLPFRAPSHTREGARSARARLNPAQVACLLAFTLVACGRKAAPPPAPDAATPAAAQATGERGAKPAWASTASPPPDEQLTAPTGHAPRADAQSPVFVPEIRFAPAGPVPFRMDASTDPDEPMVITGTPLTESSRDAIRAVLLRELRRYPAGVLNKPGATVLSMVIVCDTLAINGKPVSGTYISGIVFIAAGAAVTPGMTRDEYNARTLHHELSSLFRLRYPSVLDEKRFRAALPAGFAYADEKPGADPGVILEGQNALGSLDDIANGFIAQYAATSLSQDFNSYAEVLVWKPEVLLRTFAADSRVGRKARVVRDFYIAIDPRFAEMLDK